MQNDMTQLKMQNDMTQFKMQNDITQFKMQNDITQFKIRNDITQFKIEHTLKLELQFLLSNLRWYSLIHPNKCHETLYLYLSESDKTFLDTIPEV